MSLFKTLIQKLFVLPLWFWHTSLVKKIFLIVLIIGIGWGIFQFFSKNTQQTAYQTATAEKGTLVVSLSQSGLVSSANNASITTQVSGVVKNVHVKNGDIVTMGDKIADVELDQAGKQKQQAAYAAYLQARNTLDSANAQMHTLQSQMFAANQTFVNDKGNTNDPVKDDPNYVQENADWLAAEAKYKNQQAVIAQAQTAVNSAWLTYQESSPTIVAPISGTVTGLTIKEGTLLATQVSDTSESSTSSNNARKVASIKTEGTPVISLDVSEIDAPKIQVGQKATVTLDAFPDKTFTGNVFSIDTAGTHSSGVTTYPTLITLDNASDTIFPNMSATANIITNTKDDVLLVPNAAVQTTDAGTSVQILKNKKLEQVQVEIGLSNDTHTEIVSGISEGDIVVTNAVNTATTTSTSTSTNSPFSSGIRMGGR